MSRVSQYSTNLFTHVHFMSLIRVFTSHKLCIIYNRRRNKKNNNNRTNNDKSSYDVSFTL